MSRADNSKLPNIENLQGTVLKFEVVRFDDLDDQASAELPSAIIEWCSQVMSGEGQHCLFCGLEFMLPAPLPEAFFLVYQYDRLTDFLVSGICEGCAKQSGDTLIARGFELYKSEFPDLRQLDPANLHEACGRA